MLDWLRRRLEPHYDDPRADPAGLAAVGRAVAARLAADPRARALGGRKAALFTVPGLFTPAECASLIAAIESELRPSTLFTTDPAGIRTSATHHFAPDSAATALVAARLDALLGLPRSHAETLQGQRYRLGEQYRHHCDYFRLERAHWDTERRRGGQRTWSAMVYLNAVEAGGETDFPELGRRIAPAPGTLVAWDNMDRKGRPNRRTRHAGLPVGRGVKYVLTQWYRLDEWSLSAR